jgi:hypothetical protein
MSMPIRGPTSGKGRSKGDGEDDDGCESSFFELGFFSIQF